MWSKAWVRNAVTVTAIVTILLLPSLLRKLTVGRSVPFQETARAIDGRSLAMVARDSATALIFVTMKCPACRTGVPEYRVLIDALVEAGIAVRLVANDPLSSAQYYAALVDRRIPTIGDSAGTHFKRAGITSTPSIVIVPGASA